MRMEVYREGAKEGKRRRREGDESHREDAKSQRNPSDCRSIARYAFQGSDDFAKP